MPPPKRVTTVAGLAACRHCGFEARGAIRKHVRASGSSLSCQPCAAKVHGDFEDGEGLVSVWAPETSQAALASLVRTAHVILHLHAGAPVVDPAREAAGPGRDGGLDLDFGDFNLEADADAAPGVSGRAEPLVVGARRVIRAVTVGRRFAVSLVTAKLGSRGGRPREADAERTRRLQDGIRVVPATLDPAEIERWIEGGGTYAGWTAETLAAQVG